jgi:squalene-hopene/tetraprenyl-beta-curcumene cyclase
MKTAIFAMCVVGACSFTSLFAQEPHSDAAWSGKAAAAYLDGRMSWWMDWPQSARDHETFCVSCHTVLPYALARPTLRAALTEQASPIERRLTDNVAKRVRMWERVEPFYPDKTRGVPKTAESRGTESILNALILVSQDSPGNALSADAKLALENMWGEQLKTGEAKGAWSWLQFHNAPWEGDSQYYGATLAAIAVGAAPDSYRSSPGIQDGMKLLRDYLTRERESQTLFHRVMLLWASARVPGLLTPPQQKAIAAEALGKQQPDGGFSMSSFVGGWKRKDNTPLEANSDGYATGIVIYALQQTGMAGDQDPVKRALAWLERNQDKAEGRWLAYSLNKQRDLSSDVGKFMSDAATAHAVLALIGAN